MIPNAPGSIRAARRPLVILGVAATRLLCGWLLALPLAAIVAESGVGQRDAGDRALFEGGGYLLLEVLRLHGPSLAGVARSLLPLLGLGLLVTTFGNAALLVALNTQGALRSFDWLGRAARRVPALCVLGVGTALAQGVSFLMAALIAGGLPDPLDTPRLSTALQLAPWLVAALVGGALGGFTDLSKAALVRYEVPLVRALAYAGQAARARPLFGSFGWLPYAAAFVSAGLAAAWLTGMVDVGRAGAWRVAAVLLLHQTVVVISVGCRAAWLASALRGVSGHGPRAPAASFSQVDGSSPDASPV